MRVALFWDIDGTLLTTARAGVFALEAALRDLTEREVDLQGLVTAGLTDPEVAALSLEAVGTEASDERVADFPRAYEAHLPSAPASAWRSRGGPFGHGRRRGRST